MKLTRFTVILAFCAMVLPLQAQVQMPNPGFENWPGEVTASPKGWHSFNEAGGVFAKTMSNKGGPGNPAALERVAGHSGKYAVVIRCTKILGVSANGALTSGRVYMGAMGAASAKNYCYTDRANGYAFKFTGRPDSISFWAKFDMKESVYATAKAHLHTDCDFRDFVDIGQESDIASAILYFKNPKDGKWHKYKQAFKAYDKVYKATAAQAPIPTLNTWTRKPSYLLFCFSTNRYVMTGNKGDALYLDDIRLIYNKNLSAIQVDGTELYEYNKGKQDYVYFVSNTQETQFPEVTASAESPRAVVEVRQATAENPVAEIKVYHDDVYAGEAEPEVYTVRFVSLPSVYAMSEWR
ncbi:MAG: hypothetical protein IKN99_05050 [Bacteroidales bacterium]|nr:hypothetical protein [Bacteroidales bacterium]